MAPLQRLPGVDALKGLGCVLIVWHHLAFYGPMSDVVHGVAPALMDWLYSYARMAVQVFLVLGGFLAAVALAPEGAASFQQPLRLILQRYRRLALPLVVAVLITVAVAALVRPWLGLGRRCRPCGASAGRPGAEPGPGGRARAGTGVERA